MNARRRAVAGWLFPGLAALAIAALAYGIDAPPRVARGVSVGVTLATLLAYLSTAALRWSWDGRYFWWVWGGGVLFRLVAFVVTAIVVYRFTQLSFVATMTSMVASMTVFLVVEAATCLKG